MTIHPDPHKSTGLVELRQAQCRKCYSGNWKEFDRLLHTMTTLVVMLLALPSFPASVIPSVSALTTTTTGTAAHLPASTRHSPPLRPFVDSYQTRATAVDDASTSERWTLQEMEDFADSVGVVVSLTTFGPGYRAVARAKHDESIIMGYVEGFLRPTQPELLHIDKMEIFQPVMDRVRRARPGSLEFGGISIGLGLLMGYRCLLHATAEEESRGRKPRTIAEFLAIDDEEFQHKRLVRYYRYAGFKVVKYVGDEFESIPDRLVWGGCGTLMEQDISVLMDKWSSLFDLMKTRAENGTNSTSDEKTK